MLPATTAPCGPLARVSEARLQSKIGIDCPPTVAVSCFVFVLMTKLVSVTFLPLWPKVEPPGVINGPGERRPGDLAAADRKEQRRLSGCRGDGGDGDVGLLEGRRYRRIDDDIGAITDDRRQSRGVLGRGRRALGWGARALGWGARAPGWGTRAQWQAYSNSPR